MLNTQIDHRYDNNIIIDSKITDFVYSSLENHTISKLCIIFLFNKKEIYISEDDFWNEIELRVVDNEMIQVEKEKVYDQIDARQLANEIFDQMYEKDISGKYRIIKLNVK